MKRSQSANQRIKREGVSKSKLKLQQVLHIPPPLLSPHSLGSTELDLSVLEAVEAYQEEKELQQQQPEEDEARSEEEDAPSHLLNRKM